MYSPGRSLESNQTELTLNKSSNIYIDFLLYNFFLSTELMRMFGVSLYNFVVIL